MSAPTTIAFGDLRVGDVFLRTINGTAAAIVVESVGVDDETRRPLVVGCVVGTDVRERTRFDAKRVVTAWRTT